MKTEASNYFWLAELGRKILSGQAVQKDKDALMAYLYDHGEVLKDHYDDYLSGKDSELIFKMAFSTGAIYLLKVMLKNLLSSPDTKSLLLQ